VLTRRRFLRALTASCGLGLGLGLYTWRWEPHWVEWVERPLPIANLTSGWLGRRVVQLSDLHIGPNVDDAYLTNVFARVNAMAADLVLYTGDFTSYSRNLRAHAQQMFQRLPRGSIGTFGVLGNHDYGPGWAHPEVADQLAALAANAGIRILRNEIATVNGLQIIGLDDLWAHRFDLGETLQRFWDRLPSLALSHNPDTVDRAGWEPYSGWILAGHTHGGQCKPPFLPPPLLPVENRRYQAGVYELSGRRRLYINRGLGHLTRVRFNVRPEVTIFSLIRDI
jgi:uncharacterized protein